MKISEPKTPFRSFDPKDDEEYQKEIEEMLEQAKSVLDAKQNEKCVFEARRKAHYRKEEGELLRKVREKKIVKKHTADHESEEDE